MFLTSETHPEVLIIEDDPGIRDALATLFRFMKLNVEWAESGEEALSKISRFTTPPKLIIIDGKLPDTHGQKLSSEIRTQLPSDTVFYLFSAEANQTALSDEKKLWNGFIPKPFDIFDFISVIKKHCDVV